MLYLADSTTMREYLDTNSVHAVVCDPPYGMHVLNNEWDKILPPQVIWNKCYEVLRPGGFLLAFGHTRLYHRLGCQLEDAGFIIKDCLCWGYASGYPHSLNPSTEIDKQAGHQRHTYDENGRLTEPVTEDAKTWDGFGTVLKTAWEPIILAQKPIEGSYVENIIKYKVGVLNIRDCRIPYVSEEDKQSLESFKHFAGKDHGDAKYFAMNAGGKKQANVHPDGRWPANLLWLDPLFDEYDHIFMVPKPTGKEKKQYMEHDTIKPVRLMERLVSLVTPRPSVVKEDVVVLDPFAGTGTTGVACKILKRKFIGFENHEPHFKIAQRRLQERSFVDIGEM